MTLDEAIKHCEEVAHEKRIESGECISVNDLENAEACYECGEDHKQLAEWLTELKQRREAEISAKPVTNADRIRQMTDEELARFLGNFDTCIVCQVECTKEYPCNKGIMEWLKRQEVSKDAAD